MTAGDAAAVQQHATELETTWDDAEPRLRVLDPTAWTFLDREIDRVLTAVRADQPDTAEERSALTALITSLGG